MKDYLFYSFKNFDVPPKSHCKVHFLYCLLVFLSLMACGYSFVNNQRMVYAVDDCSFLLVGQSAAPADEPIGRDLLISKRLHDHVADLGRYIPGVDLEVEILI